VLEAACHSTPSRGGSSAVQETSSWTSLTEDPEENNQQQSSESGAKTKLEQVEAFILNFDLQLAVASPNFRQARLTNGYISKR